MPRLIAHLRVGGVDAVHVVALFVRHHFQREFVVVAQEQRPLAVVRNSRRLLQDVDEGIAVLHASGHEHARHERKMEGHVALVAVAEVGDASSGHWLASASSMRDRKLLVYVPAQLAAVQEWVSGRFSQLVPSRS